MEYPVARSLTYNPSATAGKNALHMAFGVDENYLPAMAVTILSIVEHNRATPLVFHVIVNNLPEGDLALLEQFAQQVAATIRVHALGREEFARIPDNVVWSQAADFRLFIGPLLASEAAFVLYSDCDIVCLRAFPPLPDLVGRVMAAALDVEQDFHNRALNRPSDTPYFNSGVLYIDTARWNALNLTEATLSHRAQHPEYRYPDQDALNVRLKDDILPLDRAWNTFWDLYKADPEAHADAIFLHYTGHKPWLRWSDDYLEPHFARYIDQSPWPRDRLLAYPIKRSHKRIYARYLLKKGRVMAAALWFARYLATAKGVKRG